MTTLTTRNGTRLSCLPLGTMQFGGSVAWAARHPIRPLPIISARSVAQLRPSLQAEGFAMSAALYNDITTLSLSPPPATDRLEET